MPPLQNTETLATRRIFQQSWFTASKNAELDLFINGKAAAPSFLPQNYEFFAVEYFFQNADFVALSPNEQVSLLAALFNDELSATFAWSRHSLLSIPSYNNRSPLGLLIDEMTPQTAYATSFLALAIPAHDPTQSHILSGSQAFLSEPNVLVQKIKIIHETISEMRKGPVRVPYLEKLVQTFEKKKQESFWTKPWPGDEAVLAMVTTIDDKTYIDFPQEDKKPENNHTSAMAAGDPRSSGTATGPTTVIVTPTSFWGSSALAKPSEPKVPENHKVLSKAGEQVEHETVKAKFQKIIGLSDQKTIFKSIVRGRMAAKLAQKAGLVPPVNDYDNFLICGPSGTGKSTLAEAIAFALKATGIANPYGAIGLISGANLAGAYIGTAQKNISENMNACQDGVLIINEVDALLNVPEFGQNALDALNAQFESMQKPPIVILTSYGSNVPGLIATNEGLGRRFQNVLKIEPYSHNDLMRIWDSCVAQAGMRQAPGSHECAAALIRQLSKRSDFSYVGTLKNVFTKTWENIAARVSENGTLPSNNAPPEQIKETLGTITKNDIPMWHKGALVRRPQTTDQSTAPKSKIIVFNPSYGD